MEIKQLMRIAAFLKAALLCGQLEQPLVDYTQADIALTVDTLTYSLNARVEYQLEAKEKISSFYLDARNLEISRLRLNGRKTHFKYDGARIQVRKKLKPGKEYRLNIEYRATPKQTVYFVGWGDTDPGNNQVWTQGQGKYTSHWLPSPDDMNDKLIFNVNIGFDPKYTVLSNGILEETRISEALKYWTYTMDKPMSSYLLAFAIGNYDKTGIKANSGIPIWLYNYKGQNETTEPTYRFSKALFDYLEEEIGVPYPWGDYKQVPAQDFLYAGMENTGLTVFSDDFLIDSIAFKDKNYVEVNAHELAHQWFGNLVTEQDGKSHWLHEGFATYYALLAEKEVLGEETFYWKLFDKARELKSRSDRGQGEALTDAGASSLTFYDKGAWALVILRDRVGEEAFRAAIRNFLNRYKFKNATILDFLAMVESASGTSLDAFHAQWLKGTEFPDEETTAFLRAHAKDILEYLALQHEVRTSSRPNTDILRSYWKRSTSTELKRRSLTTYFKSLSEDFIREALQSGDMDLRQAVALSASSIPMALKADFETLLQDASYTTIEQALYLLWVHYPENRARYLEQTKGIRGFSDRNVELLWLLLASLTPEFESQESRNEYRKKLSGYTSDSHPFQVRQRAFLLLAEIKRMGDENIKDLMRAADHPQYQFRQLARELLNDYLDDSQQRERLQRLAQELNKDELRYINTKLKSQ